MTLAPRRSLTLAGGEPPIGDVWGDAVVEFPEHLKVPPLRCAVSGVRPKVGEGRSGGLLPVADALRFFPVGVFLTDL